MKRGLIVLLSVAVIAVVGGAAYLGLKSGQAQNKPPAPAPQTVPVTRGNVEQSVAAPGALEGTKQQVLSFGTSGILGTLKVHAGDTVQAGQVLAQLDTTQLQQALDYAQGQLDRAQPENARQLAAAQLDLQVAQANLNKARTRNGSGGEGEPEAVTLARSRLEQAKNQLWSAQSNRDSICGRSKGSDCNGAQAAVNNAEESVRQAQIQLQQAIDQAALDTQTAQDDLVALQAAVDRANIALERLKLGVDPQLLHAVETAQAALNGATIRAPFAGVVLDIPAKLGQQMGPGQTVVLLGDPNALEVRSTVTEEDLMSVKVGQAVQLAFDAQPALDITGHVTQIVPQRADQSRALYPVFISLDQPAPGMLPGMTADATIIIESRENVLRLPRALVHAGSSNSATVKVWANGQEDRRTIKLGLRGDTYVEILEGLQEGDQVVNG